MLQATSHRLLTSAAAAEPGSWERLGLSIEAVQAQLEGVLERADIVMGTLKSTLAA